MLRPGEADGNPCYSSRCICRTEVGRNLDVFGYCSPCDVFVCDVCRKAEECVLEAEETGFKQDHVVSNRKESVETGLKQRHNVSGMKHCVIEAQETGMDHVVGSRKECVLGIQDTLLKETQVKSDRKKTVETGLKQNHMVSGREECTPTNIVFRHDCDSNISGSKEPTKCKSRSSLWEKLKFAISGKNFRNLQMCNKVTQHKPAIN